jgi:hypothetical protein
LIWVFAATVTRKLSAVSLCVFVRRAVKLRMIRQGGVSIAPIKARAADARWNGIAIARLSVQR